MRARTAWALTLPILILGEVGVHGLIARLFDPHGERHVLLARTAQDYLAYLQAAVAICLALAAAALVSRAVASFRGRAAGPLPSWQLAAVPSLAFLVQEQRVARRRLCRRALSRLTRRRATAGTSSTAPPFRP